MRYVAGEPGLSFVLFCFSLGVSGRVWRGAGEGECGGAGSPFNEDARFGNIALHSDI